MTETEAKTKWCPMVRIVVVNGHVQENRHGQFRALGDDATGPFCIGSACMMWRWETHQMGDWPPERVGDEGYCGLAGQP